MFPYPVARDSRSDYSSNPFEAGLRVHKERSSIKCIMHFVISDAQLQRELESNKAEVCAIVECAITGFRRVFMSAGKRLVINLSSDDIYRQFDILPAIICTEQINDYQNPNLDMLFSRFDISYYPGDFLAIGEYFKVSFEQDDQLETKKSIVSFVKKLEENLVKFEIFNDTIQILIPEDEFYCIQKLQETKKFASILYSMLIFPAFVFVFEEIRKSDVEAIQEFEAFRWYQVIRRVMETMGLQLNADTITAQTSFVLAQKLLQSPVGEALRNLADEEDDDED